MVETAIAEFVHTDAPARREGLGVLPAPRAGLGTVAACILLGGGLRPSPLAKLCPCSVLDLMVLPGVSVLQAWCSALAGLGRDGRLPVTLALGDHGVAPATTNGHGSIHLVPERDLSPYRGPAGAVRDRCASLDADAIVLIGESARHITADLSRLVATHLQKGHDVTVGCNADGGPAGIYAVRKRALDMIPKIGFMDLKEQWLAAVGAGGGGVFVHRFDSGGAYPLRTREQFLDAVLPAGRDDAGSSIVSGTAEVADGALVSRSIVMQSACVAAGAVVVRSLVLPGARVEAGAVVVDRVVSAALSPDAHEGPKERGAARPLSFGAWRRSRRVVFG